jgi:hypothetical protein
MSDPTAPQADPDPEKRDNYPPSSTVAWLRRRREKAVAEVEANRRGEYRVPTWVLVTALVVVVLAWAAIIAFG